MNKMILLIPILGIFLIFSGCINSSTDLQSILLANSTIGQFKALHPNAVFQSTLWNASDLVTNKDVIISVCGKTLDDGNYYHFTLTEKNDVIEGFVTADNYNLICIKNYNPNPNNTMNPDNNGFNENNKMGPPKDGPPNKGDDITLEKILTEYPNAIIKTKVQIFTKILIDPVNKDFLKAVCGEFPQTQWFNDSEYTFIALLDENAGHIALIGTRGNAICYRTLEINDAEKLIVIAEQLSYNYNNHNNDNNNIAPIENCSHNGVKMTFNDAKLIATAGNCKYKLKPNHFCNENSGTWWIDLDIQKKGCNPACVINAETKESEINWRCTGLIAHDNNEITNNTPDSNLVNNDNTNNNQQQDTNVINNDSQSIEKLLVGNWTGKCNYYMGSQSGKDTQIISVNSDCKIRFDVEANGNLWGTLIMNPTNVIQLNKDPSYDYVAEMGKLINSCEIDKVIVTGKEFEFGCISVFDKFHFTLNSDVLLTGEVTNDNENSSFRMTSDKGSFNLSKTG